VIVVAVAPREVVPDLATAAALRHVAGAVVRLDDEKTEDAAHHVEGTTDETIEAVGGATIEDTTGEEAEEDIVGTTAIGGIAVTTSRLEPRRRGRRTRHGKRRSVMQPRRPARRKRRRNTPRKCRSSSQPCRRTK